MFAAPGLDVGGAGAGADASADSSAVHLAVSRLTIGSWNLVAKHDEHVLLSLYWAERKMVWEVLHAGVVRKMEVGFEDVVEAVLSSARPSGTSKIQFEELETIEDVGLLKFEYAQNHEHLPPCPMVLC